MTKDRKEGTEETNFKKWYEENKEEVSKRRKTKYQEDPEYKAKKKLEATRYYWLKQRRAKSIGMNQADYEELEIQPSSTISITIENEKDIRYGRTYEVPVFYPKQVAEVVRRSTQTLRLWFLEGMMEDVFKRNAQNYRVFTEDQLRVFVENRHWLSFGVQDFRLHPFFALVNEQMERLLPDGIEPMLEEEWREDPSQCPFCGSTPSLQKKVDGRWEHVSCMSCTNPLDVLGRERLVRYLVNGECPYCNSLYEEEVEVVAGRDLNVICQRCGRRLEEYRKVEIERGSEE